MNEFESRINLNVQLEVLAKDICEKYGLGQVKKCKVIEIGYEDFNFILESDSGKFVVKVFNKDRSDEDCVNLANRAYLPYEKGFSCPKIYKHGEDLVFVTTIKDVKYRLIVMEYICGKDFYSLGVLPTDEELEQIAINMAKLNEIDFKPPFIYDHWAIVNYAKEYEANIQLIESDKQYLDKALNLFNSVDFSKLKYGFVHGDIIKTNVIREDSGKLYIIDFSVSNYLPRIVDLAVTIGDLCFDIENENETIRKTKVFLSAYESRSKLAEYEKETLKKFLYCHQAITILETTREKVLNHNDSEENELFARESKCAIKMLEKVDIF